MTEGDKTDRNAAVVAVVLARYLATRDPMFLPFCRESLDAAKSAGIGAADLTMLRMIIGAIGGAG